MKNFPCSRGFVAGSCDNTVRQTVRPSAARLVEGSCDVHASGPSTRVLERSFRTGGERNPRSFDLFPFRVARFSLLLFAFLFHENLSLREFLRSETTERKWIDRVATRLNGSPLDLALSIRRKIRPPETRGIDVLPLDSPRFPSILAANIIPTFCLVFANFTVVSDVSDAIGMPKEENGRHAGTVVLIAAIKASRV